MPAQVSSLTVDALQRLLATPAQHSTLARELPLWLGRENLKKGVAKPEELKVAFAIELETEVERVEVHFQDERPALSLQRLGSSKVFAAVHTVRPEGDGFRWYFRIDGKRTGGGELEAYTTPPEAKKKPGVPEGKLTQQPVWKSQVFPGTVRNWWLYVPAQYDPSKSAAVMIFQDGHSYKDFMPTMLDNLIAQGEVPVSIGIFLSPGHKGEEPPANGWSGSNRSFEYDTLSDQYARFVLEEILPEVGKRYNLRKDAAGRMVAGISSGGICAFTLAWERPDQFHKVLSWVGSFTNLQGGPTGVAGGNTYPAILRNRRGWEETFAPKPIRVFLQDGANDLDNKAGNWPLANQEMAKALAFGRYDYKFVFGNGFHGDRHGRALLPDSLRWLWRDDTKNPTR